MEYNNTNLAFAIDLDMDSSILTEPEELQDGVLLWNETGGCLLSPGDALVMSIRSKGRVDIPLMAKAAGMDADELISSLGKSIFCNPEKWNGKPYEGWETADEYLSGDLLAKLEIAKRENVKYRGRFNGNIWALKNIIPPELGRDEIYVTLGSPWVPEDVICSFIKHILDLPKYDRYRGLYHNESTGSWKLDNKGWYKGNLKNTKTFGTQRLSALQIIERTLNMSTIYVYKPKPIYHSSKPNEIDREETAAALEKQSLIVREFERWIWKDEKRAQRIRKTYNERFGTKKPRHFDGSFLNFPGMSDSVELFPYQKDAVARILFSPNTLLAHDVGAGKTYIMIAAAMEMKRMGIARKSMFVVPNSITGQWMGIFREMYPEAKVMNIKPADFTPKKRNATLAAIRDAKDVDGIIIPYSCFDKIRLSGKMEAKALRAEKQRILDEIIHENCMTRRTSSRLRSIDTRLNKLSKVKLFNADDVFFDDLGIDRLFVDEAHNYKNVSITSGITGVLGMGGNGSDKSDNMMQKVRYMQNHFNGGGVIMATGTPITNSISDIYVFQSYLQGGELELLGLGTFDAWVGMFAEKTTEFEVGVTSNAYRMATRFSKFHNVPELTTLLASIADFHEMGPEAGLPAFEGYTDITIPCDAFLRDYIYHLSKRADDVHEHRVKVKEDNMLKITSDSRKAALDIRLIMGEDVSVGRCKVYECAERVALIYNSSKEKRLTQLIFCDSSTPKKTFNVYDAMRDRLVWLGVNPAEIAFVHDADTEEKREKLFEKVRSGEIRILLGSTMKLGIGVNVQDRLTAIHHLDIPWRPADMVQREGRMLRAGNINEKVDIYRYITKESFDAYSWQILETKQKFISDLFSGTTAGRSGSDVDNTALDYAEVKALAIGNPLVKTRVEASNELARLKMLNVKEKEARLALNARLKALPDIIDDKEIELINCKEDADFVTTPEASFAHLFGMSDILTSREKEKLAQVRGYYETHVSGILKGTKLPNRKSVELITYRGFKLRLPAGTSPDNPYLEIRRCGTYIVPLKDKSSKKGEGDPSENAQAKTRDKEIRYLVRVDNVINRLDARADRLHRELNALKKEMIDIKNELEINCTDYSDKIDSISKKLKELDEEIGVKIG